MHITLWLSLARPFLSTTEQRLSAHMWARVTKGIQVSGALGSRRWALPVCKRMCTLRLPEVEKLFMQCWHLNALMPVWVLMWAVSVLLTAKARKHWGHLKGFSCVWMRM